MNNLYAVTFLVLLVLKLLELITLSWWWVFLPLMVPWIILATLGLFAGLGALVIIALESLLK
jgi:hypothetical protein